MKTQFQSTPNPCARHSRRHGQTMIGLLVVVVIMIGMSMMFLGSRRGKNGEVRPSVAKESIERSKEVGVGGNNIRQIGMCIDMYKGDNNGQVPPDLPALKAYCKEIPAPMWVDPTDGRPYEYDPQTGTVYSPGHAPPAASSSSASSGSTASSPSSAGAPPAAAPPAAQPPLPGNRGPGGVRLPDMQPQTPVDADQ